MGPDIFKFITPYAPDQGQNGAMANYVQDYSHREAMKREDTRQAEERRNNERNSELRANQQVLEADAQNWSQKKDAVGKVAEYRALINQHTKEANAKAAEMADEMKVMGLNLEQMPDDHPATPFDAWAKTAATPDLQPTGKAPIPTGPEKPAAERPEAKGPPMEKGLAKDIAKLPDELPGNETPGPQTAPKKPIPRAPLLSKFMLAQAGDQGTAPSEDERLASERRIMEMGGTPAAPVQDYKAPIQDYQPPALPGSALRPVAPPPEAPAEKPKAKGKAQAAPVETAPPVQAPRSPKFRITFRGEDLGVVDPNPGMEAAGEQARAEQGAYEGSVPGRYGGQAQSALSAAKTPGEIERAKATYEQTLIQELKNEAAIVVGGQRVAAAGAGQVNTAYEKGQNVAQKLGEKLGLSADVKLLETIPGTIGKINSGNYNSQMSALYGVARANAPGDRITDKDFANAQNRTLWEKLKDTLEGTGAFGPPTLSASELQRMDSLLQELQAAGEKRMQRHYSDMERGMRRIPGGEMQAGAHDYMDGIFGGHSWYHGVDIGGPASPQGPGHSSESKTGAPSVLVMNPLTGKPEPMEKTAPPDIKDSLGLGKKR